MDRTPLPNVTLIAVACTQHGQTLLALKESLKKIKPARTVFITDVKLIVRDSEIEVVQIQRLSSWEAYNEFIIDRLHEYFNTSHCLLIQHDGYVLNGDVWTDEFLEYDYIGALWNYAERNNGNGGHSLRSHRLQDILSKSDFIEVKSPEDEAIGRLYRRKLENEYGIKFAPDELCNRFSFETNAPYQRTFGFHNYFHPPFKDHVIIRRTGALGDLIMAEPLMDYYNSKGYQVVLDTNVSYMSAFMQHRYEIKHLLQIDRRIQPIAYIDLDMSYEHTPKQLVLKSYYNAAGVEDGETKNAQLDFPVNHLNKVFKKYAVIHTDRTGIPHREINEIKWKKVTEYLKQKGYDVFQVGNREHEVVGIEYNTNTLASLMFVLAGADIFIGNDSGVGQMAIALKRPSIVFYGSVNPAYRHATFENIYPIHTPCPSAELEYCYHNSVDSVIGTYCVFDEGNPPCTRFNTNDVIAAIETISNK